jgi:hypothetical protein
MVSLFEPLNFIDDWKEKGGGFARPRLCVGENVVLKLFDFC